MTETAGLDMRWAMLVTPEGDPVPPTTPVGRAVASSRSWLERNKIFFELVLGVLISGAAVFVSVMQWRVSVRQNEMVEIQLKTQTQLQYLQEEAALTDLRDAIAQTADHLMLLVKDKASNTNAENIRIFYKNMLTTLHGQARNPILLQNMKYRDPWTRALTFARHGFWVSLTNHIEALGSLEAMQTNVLSVLYSIPAEDTRLVRRRTDEIKKD